MVGGRMNSETTLYDKIGGEAAVAALVDDLYRRILADPDLKRFFEHHALERILSMQRELFCQALGGPLKYSGKPLSTVHYGQGIRMPHFQKFVGHVMAALEKTGLNAQEQSEALAALAVDADDIVGGSNLTG